MPSSGMFYFGMSSYGVTSYLLQDDLLQDDLEWDDGLSSVRYRLVEMFARY